VFAAVEFLKGVIAPETNAHHGIQAQTSTNNMHAATAMISEGYDTYILFPTISLSIMV
jgi:hypothetical protein